MTIHYKAVPLEIVELKANSTGTGWEFTAYASTFGNKDHGGDIVQKGAFKQTLTDRKFRPLLWQHDMREPIGIEKALKEDSHGLLGTWELIDTQRGSDAHKLLKMGAVRSMSIGYIPTKFEFEDGGETTLLNEVDLLENSVVSLPMNEQATVQSVKHLHCVTCGDHLNGEHETPKAGEQPELKVDGPLDELLSQIRGYVIVGVDEAEALQQRRAGEQRKLSEGHIEALKRLSEELKGSDERIAAILRAVEAITESPDTKSGSQMLDLRLEILRRRLRAAGVEGV